MEFWNYLWLNENAQSWFFSVAVVVIFVLHYVLSIVKFSKHDQLFSIWKECDKRLNK